MKNLCERKLVSIFFGRIATLFLPVMVAMALMVAMPILHAEEEEEEDLDARMVRITNQIADLQKEITQYVAGVTEGTVSVEDSELVTQINAINQIMAYTKPAGTLVFNINELLMAADIDIQRMEKSGKNYGDQISTMKENKEQLDNMKGEIAQVYTKSREVKMNLRELRDPFTNRTARFTELVKKMETIIGDLSQTVAKVEESKTKKRPKPIAH